ncbi:MAG: hypothetical protein LN415_04435 [Candidatus Thermoplasmatota archaeon]|nr:hypothetical protein [Candidatus Thermoplasmatota archaeon]
MKTPMIWKKLLIDGHKIATSTKIHELARRLEKGDVRSLRYLQEQGYISRILRGIYYVKSPDERERGFFQHSVYEMVSKALKAKGVKHWYFGLETALRLNGMTHEYFAVDYVITDSYRSTKVINILDTKFQFLKWSKRHFDFGIVRRDGLMCSDKEKTVLDLAYRRYRRGEGRLHAVNLIQEYMGMLDKWKFENCLDRYPQRFQKAVKGSL